MSDSEIKVLKNKAGKILFVGSLSQIKRRLKRIFKRARWDKELLGDRLMINDSQVRPLPDHPIRQLADWGGKTATSLPPEATSLLKRREGLQESKKLKSKILNPTSSAGPMPFLLWQAGILGYEITASDSLPSTKNRGYNERMDRIKEKLKDIPREPGVYQFLDKDGEVIYVGKAKNLRTRISQYISEKDDRPQVPYLLQEMADVKYTVVTNELESLFLENTIIKERFPKYNIQLRDDKNYAFIKIDYSTEIPQITTARKLDPPASYKLKAKSSYFGPYSAAYKIRHTLNLLRKIFPYCAAEKVSNRPCFYYYLHRCPGVCIGKISLDEYRTQLERIEEFLAGNAAKIRKDLERDMKLAARQERFEQAARLRDQLQSLELLDERQIAILARPVSWDVISIYEDQGYACVNLFKIRNGKMLDKENFVYDSDAKTRIHLIDANILQTFLEQYYLEASDAPREVYTEKAVENKEPIEQLLQSRFNRKISISVPKRGKQVELVNLGKKNAEEYLKHWLTSRAGHLDKIQEGLSEIKNALGLEKTPERIECYDISNTQGTNPVGSMVVFKNGVPAKSEYRKFKIRGKSTPDDFAMMKEMLTRRISRLQFSSPKIGGVAAAGRRGGTNANEIPPPPAMQGTPPNLRGERAYWPVPDLIVIDGGKGQLNAALEALQATSYQLPAIPIIGLAKRIEEIFLPDQSNPITLPHKNPGLQLLQRLRDETHRFGITFHRQLRSKHAVKSALDSIPGIGPKTKKLLKEKFGTVANIRKAGVDDLSKIVGLKLAEQIKKYL